MLVRPPSSMLVGPSLSSQKKKRGRERECVSERSEERNRGAHKSKKMTPTSNVNGEHIVAPPRSSNNTVVGPPPGQSQPQQPPAPGQHHHYYHYPPPSSSSSASFKGCCCCLFLFLAFLALLALAVVLVIVLAIKPKKPQFDLQEVTVQYLGLSSPSSSTSTTADGVGLVVPTTTSTSASLSLRIGMIFTAANENKVGIKYGESRFTVMYRGVPLGRASVPGFYQPAHSVRRVSTTVAVDRVNLLQTDAADLMKDALVNDRVELRVLGDVAAKIRIVGLTSPAVQVLYYSSLSLSLSSSFSSSVD